jgi:hypothetical protein
MNTMGLVVQSYYDILDGNVPGFEGFKEDAPEGQTSNYYLIRAEGETDQSNKRTFSDESVVIIDIVTVHENNIDRSLVEGADHVISGLILPTPQGNVLSGSGIQILNVKRENSTYLTEQDQSRKYYRKVSRYTQTITQTA